MSFARKVGAVLSAALLSTCMLAPASVHAATADTQTRTITWGADDAKPAFDEKIVVDGRVYTLASVDIQDGETSSSKVPAEWTEWAECAPGDLDATIASFPEYWHFDQDGREGDIPRTGIGYEAVESEQTVEVNRTVTTSGLASNDASWVPTQISVTGPSGNEVTLSAAGLSWTVDSEDEAGRPVSWTANALYRGLDTQVVIDHYVVTATYAGNVSPKNAEMGHVATLTYQAVPPQSMPASDDGIGGVIAAALAGAAALACIIGIPIWRRSNRARFTHVSSVDGSVKRTVVGSAPVKKAGNDYVVDAKNIELDVVGLTNYCAVEMPKKYVDPSKTLFIFKDGAQVYSGPAKDELRLL